MELPKKEHTVRNTKYKERHNSISKSQVLAPQHHSAPAFVITPTEIGSSSG